MAPAAKMAVNETPKRAYVTFSAGNGDYAKGVVELAKGLRKCETQYPLVVAVLPDVPDEHREILKSQGCIVRQIEPVHPPENQTRFAMAYYVINYSKLRIWEFVEYEKMICLDGDIQVFDNIDHLFARSHGVTHPSLRLVTASGALIHQKKQHSLADPQNQPSYFVRRAGIKAMEVYWRGGEYAERRHKDAGEEVVGYL
ncbi:hypothetical protein FNV43_RR15834 [Rhamnella rubrinervis]|uniref:Hexosyltransferase n=1 Tax=Rhamnella rubrinervis TaxID=2594499 RepID=A0A8K0E9M0_9ROSA|nr:hypothetical protein FNV43_RR15834 [Rhamnella rubrinervis]